MKSDVELEVSVGDSMEISIELENNTRNIKAGDEYEEDFSEKMGGTNQKDRLNIGSKRLKENDLDSSTGCTRLSEELDAEDSVNETEFVLIENSIGKIIKALFPLVENMWAINLISALLCAGLSCFWPVRRILNNRSMIHEELNYD